MKFTRKLTLDRIDETARTCLASLSSEEPVHRKATGNEVLSHTAEAIDLSRCPLPLLESHDNQNLPIGLVENMVISGGKLRGTLRFGLSTRASEIWSDVCSGIIRNLSIGYSITEFIEEPGGIRATRWQPYEVSLVAIPADSTVGIGRSFNSGEKIMQTETTHQTRSQRKAERASAAEANTRELEIRSVVKASHFDDDYADSLVASGVSVGAAKSAVLHKMVERSEASSFPAMPRIEHNRAGNFIQACEQSLQIRSGLRVANPIAAVKDVERMDLCTMAETFLSMNGQRTRHITGRSELIRAAMGSSDFPLLLANVAGKSLQLGYANEATTHQIWTGEHDVQDFKMQSFVKLSEGPSLLEVLPNGEYKRGTFSEAAESFAVKTYGRIFEITRQAVINDDLGALTKTPAAFGASSRRVEADLVYAKLTDNAVLSDGIALFHANHGNLAATGTAISVTSLGVARAAMRKQKGVAGIGFVDPQPRFLVVPVGLETLAESILSSLVMYGQSNGVDNLGWIRNLTLVADPRLDAVSATAWYLAASPSQLDTIVRAYLAGEGRPFYEHRINFETDSTEVKARLDFGCGVIDYRGLYRNPGA